MLLRLAIQLETGHCIVREYEYEHMSNLEEGRLPKSLRKVDPLLTVRDIARRPA